MRLSAEAKVLGRSVVPGDFWGGLAASSEVGRPAAAKGLFGVDGEVVENGFEDVYDAIGENGFAEEEGEDDDGLAPKSVSPILIVGFAGCVSALGSILFSLLFETSEIRIPRNALTLPSLRLHVFLRHDRTYKRLSCPGKYSGRSPFS